MATYSRLRSADILRAVGSMSSPPSRRSGDRTDDARVFAIVQHWIAYLRATGRAGDATCAQYRRTFVAYVADIAGDPDWTGTRDPLAVSPMDLAMYLDARSPRGGYRNLAIRALGSFYGFAQEHGYIPRNPASGFRPKEPKYGPAPSLDADVLRAVLRGAERVDPRARPAIEFQYATAARVGSLVAVMPDDVALEPFPFVTFRTAKNDDPYGVPLNATGVTAARRLLELIDYRPPRVASRRPTLLGVGASGYRRWLKEAAVHAGIAPDAVWTHLIRHTTITRLAEDPSVDVRTIMAIANWRDPTLLDRYAAKSDARIRAAVNGLD